MKRIDSLVALAGRAKNLQAPPTGTRKWFNVASQGSEAVVHVYDSIGGYDGVSAIEFVKGVNEIKAKNITVHINSPGGDVFDAISMHAALVNHQASVSMVVDGIAASAASFLAMAGDSIGIEKPARMMIHDASGLTIGNEQDHREMANLLSEVSDTIAEMYADRAGGTSKEWRNAMRTETWYTSSQAVDVGLADSVLNDRAPVLDRRSQIIRARARVTLKG